MPSYLHLALYNESLGSVTNSDLNAANDGILTVRNSHLFLSEPMDLVAIYAQGSTLDRIRFANAQFQVNGIPHVWPVEQSATVPDLPGVMDLRDMPIPMPVLEEILLEATTNAAGPADVDVALWLAVRGWNRNIPRGQDRFLARATAVVAAGAESSWTTPVSVVFERELRQGVYAVIGANVVAANAVAFRLDFLDQPTAPGGRKFRPGGLVQNAINLTPWQGQRGGIGEWGRFNNLNVPQLQTFDDTAGGTYEVRLDLVRVGDGNLVG
jgi:hypothetical protein